jgi:hypothetical protein
MPSDAPIDGLVLLAGLVTFLTGAVFWKPAVYQQALPQALVRDGRGRDATAMDP